MTGVQKQVECDFGRPFDDHRASCAVSVVAWWRTMSSGRRVMNVLLRTIGKWWVYAICCMHLIIRPAQKSDNRNCDTHAFTRTKCITK